MTVLVTGATGNIGRRVVDELIRLGGSGIGDIRALTTNPAKAALPESVTAITGYLGKPETLPAAFEGVECVYLAPFPATVGPTLELMVQAGVQYVVALSGGAHWADHADAVTASGLAHTQLGPGEFCENFAMWGPQIKTGTVHDVSPEHVQSPVSMDDIARVAAHLLTAPADAHLGAMYELTGPAALSRADIARQIGAGIGVPVEMRRCSRAEAEELLRPVMGDAAHWYLDLFDGDLVQQSANDTVERLTGTPAESMAQWAARNRSLFT
ncbi:SDR family oxidoreductase [Mycobacterium sp. DL440]|uniref:SDR family oxidoreductase n=1 Tax=Mycobacterium sp. DL440 TaxID=2675523 RepID=UPI00141FC939|nr:NAD(P)H-binding protein [Mycobacterium sp. DL440]